MMAEIDAFFEDVAFQGGTFKDLFLSNVAYVNQDTAPIYGLDPAGYGADAHAGGARREPAAGLPDPRRLLGLVLGRRVHEPDPSRRVHLDEDPRGPPRRPAARGRGHADSARQLHDSAPGHRGSDGRRTAPGATPSPSIPAGFVLENYDSIGSWQTVDPLGGADRRNRRRRRSATRHHQDDLDARSS